MPKHLAEVYEYARIRGLRLNKHQWKDAEDYAQDYMIEVIERGFSDNSVQFLMTDAKFRTSGMSKRKKSDSEAIPIEDAPNIPMPDGPDFRMVENALDAATDISKDHGRLAHLVYVSGLDVTEAAEVMGKSASWAHKKHGEAVSAMRERFGVVDCVKSDEISLRHDDGDAFTGTQSEFCAAYGIDRRKVNDVVSGRRKSHKGWRISR